MQAAERVERYSDPMEHRWGQRVTPLASSDAQLPPNNQTALQIVEKYRRIKAA